MIGRIVKVNYTRGLALFEDDSGDYGYFEILGSENLEADDVIIGDLHSLGGETIFKENSKENIDIFIEDFGMSYELGMEMVFGK